MICAVSLNPAVDKYLRLERLARGEHVQVEEVITSAGGKAINVAGVLRALGHEVELIGFFGGFTGAYILDQVVGEGIVADPVTVQALTRTAFVLVESDGSETEVVEPGAAVAASELAELRAKVRMAAKRAEVMVLSGSVPGGCPDDIYVRLLADCADHCPVIVDTSRVWLRTVLAARQGPRPAAIKPNRREAEAALGIPLPKVGDMTSALRQFAAAGIATPLLSDGAAGLYAWHAGEVWGARPPQLERINSVGSGDAAVAGLAANLARGGGIEAGLRLAAACGAANALTKECAQVHAADVARLLPLVEVTRLAG